jgi:hypothetical protein
MTETQTFDLSAAADLYDQNRLRLGRWLSLGFAIAVATALVWKGLEPVRSPYCFASLSAGIVFDLFLWWGALYFFAPPPVTVEVLPGNIRFVFKTGGQRSYRTRDGKFRIRLAETLPPADSLRQDIVPDPPYFAVSGLKWIPITLEAYRAIVAELQEAQLTPTVKTRPNPPAGGWRFYTYARAR